MFIRQVNMKREIVKYNNGPHESKKFRGKKWLALTSLWQLEASRRKKNVESKEKLEAFLRKL